MIENEKTRGFKSWNFFDQETILFVLGWWFYSIYIQL